MMMGKKLFVIFLLASFSLSGCESLWSDDASFASPTLPTPLATSTSDTTPLTTTAYILGSGDSVDITVYEEEDLSGTFKIDGEGLVALPLIGIVKVAGLSTPQAEDTIEKRLKNGYLRAPRVSIQVAAYRPFYILGEVQRPGGYPYVNGMNLQNAIALSGGFTYRADKTEINIQHGGQKRQVNAKEMLNIYIQPGDIIEVEERFF